VKREKKRAVDDAEDNVQHSKEKKDYRFKEEEKQLVTDGESMKRRRNFQKQMIQILVIKYEKRIVCITSLTEENEKKKWDKLKKRIQLRGKCLLIKIIVLFMHTIFA